MRARLAALSILAMMLGGGALVSPAQSSPAAGAATTMTTAAAAPWMPRPGTTFNHARSTPNDMWAIERQLMAGINNARKGSHIRVSLFSFDRMPMTDALIRAKKRGVHVKVLLNNHQTNAAMKKLKKALGTKRKKKSWYHACVNSCRGGFENLHSKFVLFSHTGGAKKVVMTGSFNFTANAAINQHNDLYTNWTRPKLYKSLRLLFNSMKKDVKRSAKNQHYIVGSKRWELEVMPLPKWNQRNDPMMRNLGKIKCTGAKKPGGRTVVRVGMHTIAGKRGVWLAKKVRGLHAAGCDVRLWYSFADRASRNVFATGTKRGYLPVHVAGYDTTGDGEINVYGHHKTLLVSGKYGKNPDSNVIWTGSSNWTNAGMRGDEIILRLTGKGLFNAYNRNFDSIWYNHSHLARYIPYSGATRLRSATAWSAVQPEPELRRPDDWEN